MFAGIGGIFAFFGFWLKARKGFAGFEGLAVLPSEAVLVNGCDMGFGAVADVLIEAVLRIFGGEIHHIMVTGDFGDDGCGGDFADFIVGFDTCRDIVL